ncbi:MAG: PhoH family protein, partial [Bacteroidales bacterium]|nr:PhoH family protein [Bacteroidales bacterium]
MKKTFILDTNVILHDYTCIYHFEDNDIILPIVVLEELDQFKKGNDLINYHAREFTRELDKLAGGNLFTDGVELGEGRGKLFIETGKEFSKQMMASFPEKTPDHRILAIAEHLQANRPKIMYVLVSKDINLRMKAKSLGIRADDYLTGKVQDLDKLYHAIPVIDEVDDALISELYVEPNEFQKEKLKTDIPFSGQSYCILKGNNNSALAHYSPLDNSISRVEKFTNYGIKPRNAEQTFAFHALNNPEVFLVAVTGKAGTGKTLLALAAALQQRRLFKQIYLARPVVPLSNRDIGYLPGAAEEKIGPYMAPLFDN